MVNPNQDRRHWTLDKSFNVTHVLTTVGLIGSLFMYANSMDKRVAILEEKTLAQVRSTQVAQEDMKELGNEVKVELRALRNEVIQLMREPRK